MSFDKNYPNRKDHRRHYRRSKAFDRSCRNHGRCSWCESDRLIQTLKADIKASEEAQLNKLAQTHDQLMLV
jgi:hypothetical protein